VGTLTYSVLAYVNKNRIRCNYNQAVLFITLQHLYLLQVVMFQIGLDRRTKRTVSYSYSIFRKIRTYVFYFSVRVSSSLALNTQCDSVVATIAELTDAVVTTTKQL